MKVSWKCPVCKFKTTRDLPSWPRIVCGDAQDRWIVSCDYCGEVFPVVMSLHNGLVYDDPKLGTAINEISKK